jgi:hypothetical protein
MQQLDQGHRKHAPAAPPLCHPRQPPGLVWTRVPAHHQMCPTRWRPRATARGRGSARTHAPPPPPAPPPTRTRPRHAPRPRHRGRGEGGQSKQKGWGQWAGAWYGNLPRMARGRREARHIPHAGPLATPLTPQYPTAPTTHTQAHWPRRARGTRACGGGGASTCGRRGNMQHTAPRHRRRPQSSRSRPDPPPQVKCGAARGRGPAGRESPAP